MESEKMNDREVMKSLLEGKVIVEKLSRTTRCYRLKGDKMEWTLHGNTYEKCEGICMMCVEKMSV